MIISQNLLWDFLPPAGIVQLGAIFLSLVKWMKTVMADNMKELKSSLILGLNQHYQHLQRAQLPEPEPGVISHSCYGKKRTTISWPARVSSLLSSQTCDHFSIPRVPEGHHSFDTLPPIILIGGSASQTSECQAMRPIGSTSTIGVSLRHEGAKISSFSDEF